MRRRFGMLFDRDIGEDVMLRDQYEPLFREFEKREKTHDDVLLARSLAKNGAEARRDDIAYAEQQVTNFFLNRYDAQHRGLRQFGDWFETRDDATHHESEKRGCNLFGRNECHIPETRHAMESFERSRPGVPLSIDFLRRIHECAITTQLLLERWTFFELFVDQ